MDCLVIPEPVYPQLLFVALLHRNIGKSHSGSIHEYHTPIDWMARFVAVRFGRQRKQFWGIMKVLNPITLRSRMLKSIGGRLLLALSLLGFYAPAYAITFAVNALGHQADASIGDGVCLNEAGNCTLRAALEEANALPPALDDDILIVMDPALTGQIILNGGDARMHEERIGSQVNVDYVGLGAFYYVNAQRPVTIDFDNRVNAVQHSDHAYAMLYIASDNVTVQNFANGAVRDEEQGASSYEAMGGITAAEAAIVIGGSNVTVRNGTSSDPGTHVMETCLALVNSPSNVLIEDYFCRSSRVYGVYVEERANVTNLVLNRYRTRGNIAFADFAIDVGEAGEEGDKTIVDGLSILDSEFDLGGGDRDYSILIRPDAIVNNMLVSGSQFTAVNRQVIRVESRSLTPNMTLDGNTTIDTNAFLAHLSGVQQTGLTIINNIFRRGGQNTIALNSPYDNVLIENNEFRNATDQNVVAGIQVFDVCFGVNNVIRGNQFLQDEPINRLAIWIDANPGVDVSTGWSIENNHIENIKGNSLAPIHISGAGNTLMSGNTIAGNVERSTPGGTRPENQSNELVNNHTAFSNRQIQTWRPTAVAISAPVLPLNDLGLPLPGELPLVNGSVTLDVAPVNPPLAGNTEPVLPVVIDVFYSEPDANGEFAAEVYLGRIPGSHSTPVNYSFTNEAIMPTGNVRVQITDAAGRSSQYSAVPAETSDAAECLGGLPLGPLCPVLGPVLPTVPSEPGEEPGGDGCPADNDACPLVARGTGGAGGPWLLLGMSLLLLRRRRGVVASLFSFGALMGGGQAVAAENDFFSRMYVGAQVGGLVTDFDDSGLTRALQNAGYDVDKVQSDSEGLGYSLWFGFALMPSVGLEFAYITGADEEVRYDGSVGGDLDGAMDVAEPYLRGYGDSYLVRARYHHTLSESWFLSPRLGLGYTQTRETLEQGSNSAKLEDDNFSWSVGAGIHRTLSRNWSAGLSLDYVQSSSDNAYGLIGIALEWRFPQALPRYNSDAPTPSAVEVVSTYEEASPPVSPPPALPKLSDLKLDGVGFESGGSELTAEARSVIDSIATDVRVLLQHRPALDLEIAGHTDATGSAALNNALSQARAQAVVDYLSSRGVSRLRLKAVGYGSSEPVATNNTPVGRALNRRVELREAR